MPDLALDQVIRFHRKAARLTQAELAALAGVGKTSVFDVEHGKQTVRLTTLLAILKTLGINLTWDSRLRGAFETSQAEERQS